MFLSDSPAWTRLEPQSVSGDPAPGLQARVHDPAWLLARQWQLGEFRGEDTGSPVSVQVTWTSTRVDGWRPPGERQPRPLEPPDLLEAAVEAEPRTEPGMRRRFTAGAQFLAVLADAGFTDPALTADVLAACAMNPPGEDPLDEVAGQLWELFGGRIPDAERIAAALDATPAWLPAGAHDAATEWLHWYRGTDEPDCWIGTRLEYAFDLAAGPHLLAAPAFPGGRADWYHFTHLASTPGTSGTTTTAPPVWATPLRFAGMPADRYWQFEDGRVNLGALETRPHDLARLALAEFALVYSQDWLTVPVDVPFGSLTVIDRLAYTTTFGDEYEVDRADEGGRFQLFEVDGLPGLLVPPTAPSVLDGPALEEVGYLRDEIANLAWAVERTVRGPSGQPRNRADETPPPQPAPGGEPDAELDYLLQTPVPGNWIPLVPVRRPDGSLELRKGALGSAPAEPHGVLLRPGQPLTLHDEEIPREGVTVRRVPVLARRADGRYARWIARRVSVGRGEGASRLAFDTTTARDTPTPLTDPS
ncbi:hypothetical protein Cco03nite_34280 [Catellatospora coxensis]|uniref:Uncharacterized protein n=1 Tax=Catellatospora coxensis TaxID=310354 RepID=A0A8J3KQG0_9ACTN|nr:hypothetical protein Cco03nite_34280 [Catellatospora coxensis]